MRVRERLVVLLLAVAPAAACGKIHESPEKDPTTCTWEVGEPTVISDGLVAPFGFGVFTTGVTLYQGMSGNEYWFQPITPEGRQLGLRTPLSLGSWLLFQERTAKGLGLGLSNTASGFGHAAMLKQFCTQLPCCELAPLYAQGSATGPWRTIADAGCDMLGATPEGFAVLTGFGTGNPHPVEVVRVTPDGEVIGRIPLRSDGTWVASPPVRFGDDGNNILLQRLDEATKVSDYWLLDVPSAPGSTPTLNPFPLPASQFSPSTSPRRLGAGLVVVSWRQELLVLDRHGAILAGPKRFDVDAPMNILSLRSENVLISSEHAVTLISPALDVLAEVEFARKLGWTSELANGDILVTHSSEPGSGASAQLDATILTSRLQPRLPATSIPAARPATWMRGQGASTSMTTAVLLVDASEATPSGEREFVETVSLSCR